MQAIYEKSTVSLYLTFAAISNPNNKLFSREIRSWPITASNINDSAPLLPVTHNINMYTPACNTSCPSKTQ